MSAEIVQFPSTLNDIREVIDMAFVPELNPKYLTTHYRTAMNNLANICQWEAVKAGNKDNAIAEALWQDRKEVVEQCLRMFNELVGGN